MSNILIPNDPWFIERLANISVVYMEKQGGDKSYAGESDYILKLLTKLAITSGFVVDIAASNGVTQSCTLQLFENNKWGGFAVEMDPMQFAILSFIYSGFNNTRLARCRVTPKNICSLLYGNEVPPDFELLNLDIDSYDLYVIDTMLSVGFRPKIITMEINEKIPPPIYFTVTYDENHYWEAGHFYGCSIVAAAQTVKPYGYCLESIQYNNVFFVRKDLALQFGVNDLSVEYAYNVGYANRENRASLFPWNSNVDSALTSSPEDTIRLFQSLFGKYSNYILRIEY